ncbi:MAG: MBOAT family protein, partial [Firmicutes bacterium]|nr:MBOAT family protein [Bacillota bacterium]
LMIERFRGRALSKIMLASSLVINLGMLAVFKYSGFIVENINSIFALSLYKPEFSLPIGISFYTFQTLSYTIDLYRGKVKVQTSMLRFLTYVSMFPQLVAGPVVRYGDIATELRKRSVTAENMALGSRKFVCGLCKKVLIANNAGAAVEAAFGGVHMTALSAWTGIIFFTFQIYFDFSGYSDMAIGLGRMLGFHYKENFEHPYISRNITEFWRRWHISLSRFFRDCVYIPLGGNRKRHILNLLIVWFLTGLWHGASWNFVLWGLYYGVILITEKKLIGGILQKIPFPFCHIYTMFIVIMGWTLFYFTDLSAFCECVKAMFSFGVNSYDLTSVSVFKSNIWLLVLCVLASQPWAKMFYNHFSKSSRVLSAIIEPAVIAAAFAVCVAALVGGSYNPFLYFRF